MRADVACAFCAKRDTRILERSGDRCLVQCCSCSVRSWVPAILADYRRTRRKLIEALNWMRYKIRCEGDQAIVAGIIDRYRRELADLRARLQEVRRFPITMEECA
jgi:hypothetical protein